MELKTWIKDRALSEGFSAIGFADPREANFSSDLISFLGKGYAGDMNWLHERQEWRANPQKLWPECQTIIMLAETYPAPAARAEPNHAEISTYARGKDYHDIVKKRLKRLGRALISHHPMEIKVFVDTAPVMEKPLAELAGLGWQGKHGNLLSRELGNWFFLGAIFLSEKIPADVPQISHCGSCTACLDACPTQAFDADGHLNPTRCISYLTIENKGEIPLEFRKPMGNRIYGCDDCLNACPWNKFDKANYDPKLAPRPENIAPKLKDLLTLNAEEFRAHYQGSPIKRIGYERFMRNLLIAAGNSQDPTLISSVEIQKNHENPLVSEAAYWAFDQLSSCN